MADAGILIGWNRAASGREQKALELFGQVIEYYGSLKNSGRIESFEPVFLQPHGGDMNGFILIKGDSSKLDAVRSEDKFIELELRAQYNLVGFGVIPCRLGDGIQNAMATWTKIVNEG